VPDKVFLLPLFGNRAFFSFRFQIMIFLLWILFIYLPHVIITVSHNFYRFVDHFCSAGFYEFTSCKHVLLHCHEVVTCEPKVVCTILQTNLAKLQCNSNYGMVLLLLEKTTLFSLVPILRSYIIFCKTQLHEKKSTRPII
jgi:hypothetical protein